MGVGGDSAVQSHSMGGVRGMSMEGHTQEHTQERTRECCTYPLATYPLKRARILLNEFWTPEFRTRNSWVRIGFGTYFFAAEKSHHQ